MILTFIFIILIMFSIYLAMALMIRYNTKLTNISRRNRELLRHEKFEIDLTFIALSHLLSVNFFDRFINFNGLFLSTLQHKHLQ